MSLTSRSLHWLALFGTCTVLAGCGFEFFPEATTVRGPNTCTLLDQAQVQGVIGSPVLPAQQLDGGAACSWDADVDAKVNASPVPVVTPGAPASSIAGPPKLPGVSLELFDGDWKQLRAEIGHQSGQLTARAVPGVGDEAIMESVGPDWRHLSVRKGAVSFQVVVALPTGSTSVDAERAEEELGALVAKKLP